MHGQKGRREEVTSQVQVRRLRRAAGRLQWNVDIPTLMNILDLIGSIFFLIAAILAFFVPSPAPPVPGDPPRTGANA